MCCTTSIPGSIVSSHSSGSTTNDDLCCCCGCWEELALPDEPGADDELATVDEPCVSVAEVEAGTETGVTGDIISFAASIGKGRLTDRS